MPRIPAGSCRISQAGIGMGKGFKVKPDECPERKRGHQLDYPGGRTVELNGVAYFKYLCELCTYVAYQRKL